MFWALGFRGLGFKASGLGFRVSNLRPFVLQLSLRALGHQLRRLLCIARVIKIPIVSIVVPFFGLTNYILRIL